MGTGYTDKIIMSIGGSLIVPKTGIDTSFLKNLNHFIREQLKLDSGVAQLPRMTEEKQARMTNGKQFFLVVGGGTTARQYRDAGQAVVGHELSREDLDWLGIHATRLNAQLIRTIFRDLAHPFIVKNYEIIRKVTEPVVVASGWKPGWSTDYDAVLLCEDYGVKTVLNLSNVDRAYDKDPNKYPDAKPINAINWAEFRKIVGDEWVPGMNAPFDPVAAKKAEELGIKVVILNGNDFENLGRYFKGEQFVGTVIE